MIPAAVVRFDKKGLSGWKRQPIKIIFLQHDNGFGCCTRCSRHCNLRRFQKRHFGKVKRHKTFINNFAYSRSYRSRMPDFPDSPCFKGFNPYNRNKSPRLTKAF
jgi:hypothetical protein